MAEILKVINFPTQISSVTPLAWSPEYRLAIGTKKGVFIYLLTLDPYNTTPELNFKKDFIPTLPMQPEHEPLMTQERTSQLSTKMKDILIQDRVFAPFHPSADSHSHMRYVGWSPRVKLDHNQGYFLIALGFDYSFRLYYETSQDEWSSVLDLRKLLVEYANTNKSVIKANTSCERIKSSDPAYSYFFKKAYFTATLCISWEHPDRFFTGQEGGQVVFWNLVDQGEDNKISISDVFQTKLPSVTAIKSTNTNCDDKEIIFVGSLDGCVNCLIKSNKKIISFPVWEEEDRLKVLQIKIIPKTSTNNLNSYNILVAKANFVICITIEVNLTKNSVQVMSYSSINAGISHIIGIEPVLSPTNNNNPNTQLMIAASKGKLILWSPEQMRVNCALSNGENAALKVDLPIRLDRRHYCAWGLVASPNRAVYCLIENISSFNDHLLLREPSRIVFFTTASHQFVREKVGKSEFLPDFMELYRVFHLKSGLALPNTHPNLNSKWWLSNIASKKSTEAENLHKSTEIQLRVNEARRFMLRLKIEKTGKMHACRFIIKFCKDDEVIKEANNSLSRLTDELFTCDICGEDFTEESVQSLTCKNGHKVPRCGISQQPVVDPEFKSCGWCDCPYMEINNQPSRCVLCSGPVIQLDV